MTVLRGLPEVCASALVPARLRSGRGVSLWDAGSSGRRLAVEGSLPVREVEVKFRVLDLDALLGGAEQPRRSILARVLCRTIRPMRR